jgi:S-methylmethionine-dependent homocysteine/selenocysteine methylase
MSDFLQTVRERVVIYDGAMGTNIQKRNPTLDDYWGKENCSEVLVLSRPDIIRDIHADFFVWVAMCRRSAQAHPREGHHQLYQSGGSREAHFESVAHGEALWRRGDCAHYR